MNIHLPAILGFTRYQGFDPSPHQFSNCLVSHVLSLEILAYPGWKAGAWHWLRLHVPTRGPFFLRHAACKACKAKFQLEFWLGSHLYCWLVFCMLFILGSEFAYIFLAVQSVALFLAICCILELNISHLQPIDCILELKLNSICNILGLGSWQNLAASRSQHLQNMSCIMFAVDWSLLFPWYL
jgi:hypothetical protein